MKGKKGNLCYVSAAFFLPVLAMLAIYAWIGIYPFGSDSILTIDLNNQYISYFSYLKSIFQEGHSFAYSFSKTLGGDMVGMSAYYLISPLNLLFLVFPVSELPMAVEVITLVKLGLCGMSFYVCIFSQKHSWHSFIFSTSYALMSYNIVYQQNIMWLDAMVMLPLMVLGVQRFFQGRRPFFYLGVLSFAIILNYYMGFMLCIFSVLYFLYYFFFADDREKFWDFKIIFSYGAASALAGGLSMWLLFPVFKSLAGGKASFDPSLLTMRPNFHWSDFLVKFFPGSFGYGQVQAGLPNVFCGMAAVFFLALFFLNRNVPIRKKAGGAALLLVLCCSFYFCGANLVWHGFNPPAWFPYRYSFIFSFLMLLFAEEGFRKARLCTVKEYLAMYAVTLLGFLLLAYRLSQKPFPFMSKEKYLLGVAALAAYGLLYFVYAYGGKVLGRTKAQGKRMLLIGKLAGAAAVFALLVLGVGELCANGVYSLSEFHYADYGDYRKFVQTVEPAVDYVKELDQGFYRMEKTFCRKQCDPMLLRFNGLSHYSSTEKEAVKYFMGQMGFRNNGNWSYYNRGSTYAMDSLLGVKYILSKKPLGAPYQLLHTVNGISIYQNPYSFPIGFLADSRMLSLQIDSPHKFELQNELWRSLYGKVQKSVFGEEKIENVKLKNLEKVDGGKSYVKEDKSKKASIEYTFIAASADPVFAWFGTEQMQPVKVKVNGKAIGKYFDVYNYDILRLGAFEKGEVVKVQLVLESDTVNLTDIWFYHQDMEAFSQYFANLSQGFVENETFSDARLVGAVPDVPGMEYALFTIPYEEGWKAYIDGAKAEVSKGMGIFLAVKVPDGAHRIELRYVPAGMETGLEISLLSLIGVCCWGLWGARGKFHGLHA